MGNWVARGDLKARIIKAIKGPLGFFVLAVLVVETSILMWVTGSYPNFDPTPAIIGAQTFLAFVIGVVAWMAVYHPRSLYPVDDRRQRQDTLVATSSIDGKYFTDDSYGHYTIDASTQTGDLVRLDNVEWIGSGKFDGHRYLGIYQYKDSARPELIGEWGVHDAKLHRDGSLELTGFSIRDGEFLHKFTGTWKRMHDDTKKAGE